MSNRKTIPAFFAAVAAWSAIIALAATAEDAVILKDGRVLKGTVVEENAETVTFRYNDGNPFAIRRILIANVTSSEGCPHQADEVEGLEFLSGEAYLRRVREAIRAAQRSIRIMMFFANYTDHPRNPANVLLRELVEASGRGVEVKIILETSHEKIVTKGNRASADWLLERGIEAAFFPIFPVMHTKLVLIDDEISIVGSHNWTTAAVYYNIESSILVRCPRTAARFKNYFDQAYRRSTPYRNIKAREARNRPQK